MHQFIVTPICVFFVSFNLYSANDALQKNESEIVELESPPMTVENALKILQEIREEKIPSHAVCAIMSMFSCLGGCLAIPAGLGVGYVCPSRYSSDAGPFICGLSCTGLVIGSVFLLTATAVPVVCYLFNYRAGQQCQSTDELCKKLEALDRDQILSENNFEEFMTIIEAKKIPLTRTQ